VSLPGQTSGSLSLAAGDRRLEHAWLVFAMSVLTGLLLAIVWSFEVADKVVGDRIANGILQADAKALELSSGSVWTSMLFAFAAGLGATFTACNCVVFSCIAPLTTERDDHRRSLWQMLGWMIVGVVVVTASYGMAGALLGHQIPILSPAKLSIGNGYPVRLLQSTIVFCTLGAILIVWGSSTLGLISLPLRHLAQRRPWLQPLMLGVLIGCFTVGRPFPLFRKAFEHAAETGNPLLSATAMSLQGLGNVLVMVVVLLALVYGGGGRVEQWLRQHPQRAARFTALSLIIGGAFFLFYWGLRVPSYYGIGWFPHMPYR
jgi:hypothetical protein